ncbi:MAG: alpha/beta hydrolase [Proteobacteria bacterium]|nr:alpha/beta hydrolase [Pseudomonadota bacterium]
MFKYCSAVMLIVLYSATIHAKEVQLKGLDGFDIYIDYTAASNPGDNGVLMLHQCNADRSMYAGLAEKLAAEGISSVSLDFRGYGDSITDKIDTIKLKEKATSRKHYFEMQSKLGLGSHRQDDVEIAYQYLLNKLGKEVKIAFIGASCGGTQAVLLAQKHEPVSFIFFSAGMSQETQDLFTKVSAVPALMIASQGDTGTFESINTIFSTAQSDKTRMLSYKGKAHGRPLLFQHAS